MDTNAELWEKFMPYYNSYNGTNRAAQPMAKANIFCDKSAPTYKVLSGSDSDFKWLGDYIIAVAKEDGKTLGSNYTLWPHVVKAFFNKTISYEDAIDFTTAGDPSNWKSAYLESTIDDETIDLDAEWRISLNAFFMQKQIKTYPGGYITADFAIHGQPNAWKSAWWSANFPSTPTAVKDRNYLPELIREGYVFAGWYFGNDHESGNPGYDVTAPVTIDNIEYGCIYARWIDACLHEGYVTDEQMIAELRNTYKNFNIDLINALAGKQYDLKIDRKLVGGMYNTMCLPFAIEGKNAFTDIQYVDGSGQPFASVNDFSLVYFDETTVTNNVLELNFTELGENDELPANVPFLLKPNNDITKLMRYGSTPVIVPVYHAQPADDPVDNEDEGNDGDDEQLNKDAVEYGLTVGDEDAYFTFTGVLAPAIVPEGSVLLVANNRLAASSSSGSMLGMRGFFSFKAQPVQQPMAIKITTKDGATTYLDAVNMTTETQTATKILHNGQIYILRGNEVYTITGYRVQ
jgi:hypothetical protein